MLKYDIFWLVEKRVLVYRPEGAYDLEIMRRGAADVHQHVLAGVPPVHVIIDTTHLTSPSGDFRGAMNELQQYRSEQQTGWTVLAANSVLVRLFGNVAARLLQTPFRIAPSFEEAVRLLRELEPGLEQLLSSSPSHQFPPPHER